MSDKAAPPTPNLSPQDEQRIANLFTILAGSTNIVNDPLRYYREGSDELVAGLRSMQNYCYAQIAAIIGVAPIEQENDGE